MNLSNPLPAATADITTAVGVGTITDDDAAPSIVINDVSIVEASANMTFTATLSAASGKTVTVDYATADFTAIAPADYTAASGTLSFAPLVLTRTFTVPIVGDTLDEFDETFVANLTNATNATIADNQGVGTITDNDNPPGLVINNVTVTEGDAGTVTATFTVTQSAASGKTVTVDYATADVTATAPADYTATTGTLTFNPGTTTQTIPIAVQGDLLNEALETYRVTLSNAVNASITTAVGTGTITDNDPLPSIVINDVSVAEGNSGTTNADFTVTLSAPSGRNVTVNYATANSSAIQPGDYTTTSGTLTFLPGQVTKTVSVPVVGDVLDEIDETFFVNLTLPTLSTIADAQGVGTITDDDAAPSIVINDVSIVEASANMTFTATLSAASGKTVTVDYATADFTAIAPADYTAASGTLSFAPLVLTRTFTVPIVGDTLDEFDETFVANLTNATNATIADNQGVGTITDNDNPPGLVINNVTVTEGDAGTVTATFTVTQSAASGKTVTVDYATADVTATAPADYTATTGTLTFNPGTTTQTIPIAVQGDLLNEALETYRVTLSNAVNASITTAVGTGTITDNDPLPSIVINDVSVAEGNSGTTNADFTVTLSAPSGRVVTVRATTANGTATQPADYTSTNLIVTFPAGTTTQSYSVPVVGDVLDEIDETFFVNLTLPTLSTIADAQGVGTITDDDAAPSIVINDVSIVEASANMTFTATLSAASGKTVTVDYATADFTAIAPADYTAASGTLSFAPLVLTRTFTVPIVGDTLDEFDETFVANLTNATNATIADNQGVGTITDNDNPPGLVINNVTVTEGDAGTVTATFTVTQSAASGKTVTVDYATADVTATAPADYTATTGTLTFNPGTTTQTIPIAVQGDLLNEALETYRVTLSNAVNASITTAVGTGTITDNDPLPSIVINDVSVAEGNSGTTNADFTVTLSAPSGRVVTVRATTANGTATQPADYTSTNLIVTFPAGTTTQSYSVPVTGDVLDEADDTFFVNLTTPTNSTVADAQGIGTILDDDAFPTITINDVSRVEGNAGTANLNFTVTLSPVSGRTVTVDYATANLTAAAPGDYTAASGTLTFNAGTITRTVSVPIVGDSIDEFDETFVVNLSNPVNATITDNQGVGTITDNDPAPLVSVDNVTVAEGDLGMTTVTFTVSLSAASSKPISVDYATADVTATAGSDYIVASGPLAFAPGEIVKTVDVTVKGDITNESDETFTLDLSNLVNVTAGTPNGTGTITDDDPPPTVSIGDVSLDEGDVGTTTATFTISLSAASGKPISVDYASTDQTADSGDYTGVSGTLSFAPGETTNTVDVDISGDVTYENDETFGFDLSNLVNVAPGTLTATGTIRNDDGVPKISVDDQSVIEGDSGTATASFTVSLNNPSAFGVSIDYATNDDTATAPSDYVGVSGSLAFVPGETAKTVAVDVNGDTIDESDETFTVDLSNLSGAAVGDGQGVGTIRDDDAPPTIDIGDVTVTEGDVGDVTASFPVTLTGATQLPVTVDVATADATAMAGSDYAAVTRTLTFAPGETGKMVDVTVHGDATFELDETFKVQLSNATSATIGTGMALGTILNDDTTPGLVVSDISLPEGNAGDTLASFTVALGAPSGLPVTVDVATQDGTAAQPSDYDLVASSLSFAPGETTKTVDVTIHGDIHPELDETFTLQLSNAAGANIADGTGTGTIVNDDPGRPEPPPSPVDPIASIGDASTKEGAAGTKTTLTLPVILTRAAAGTVTIDYRTTDGSATHGSDYHGIVGSLLIPVGQLTGNIDVTVFGDRRVEPDETFTLEITDVVGAQSGSDGTGTILNDDRRATRLTLHVHVDDRRSRGPNHRIAARGSLIHGAPRLPVRVALLCERGDRWVIIDRSTARTRSHSHLTPSGKTAFGYRSKFRVTHGGRYRIRVSFRGDALRAPTRAHVRFRI